MPTIKIRNQPVEVDIRSELEQFNWTRPRWTSDKLLAASPFRYDRNPSFFVSLDGEYAGCFKDSGAYDLEWESGNLIKLLSFLRNETYEETEEYLLSEYGVEWKYDELVKLPKLSLNVENKRHIDKSTLESYKWRHPYLSNRGISEEVQRMARIGYDRDRQAVVIPWFNADGSLANVKYRLVKGRAFWYEKGAVPIRNLVYGINLIYSYNAQEAILCEGEIDALTWETVGKRAIAIGGVAFTDKQADIIKRSPIKRLIICGDNDKAGSKLKRQVIEKLRGYIDLAEVTVPGEYKDVNESHVNEVSIEKFAVIPIRQINTI